MHDVDPACSSLPRRELLKTALAAVGGIGLTGCVGPGAGEHNEAQSDEPQSHEPQSHEPQSHEPQSHEPQSHEPRSLVAAGDVVLFQGDSITDAGRSREHADEANGQLGMGNGYAWLAGSGLLVGHAGEDLQVYNRGISGHKVFQLADRWERDCLALKPDVLSILIGVNDIWHSRGDNYDGTVEIYERDYDALLTRTREALPDVELVICEPFVLRCGAVDDTWFPEFDEYRAAARRVANSHTTTWIPFQTMFDEAIQYAPPAHWAKDGVHPSSAGAALMAQTWLNSVG